MERTFALVRRVSAPLNPASLLRLIALVSVWRQRSRTRRQLAELSARHLSDVGISLADRHEEVAKPFWKE